jgi:hypothetical protein
MLRRYLTAVGTVCCLPFIFIACYPAAAQGTAAPTTAPKPAANQKAVELLSQVKKKIAAMQTWSGEVVTINRSRDRETRKRHLFRQRGMKFFYVEEWRMQRDVGKNTWKPARRVVTLAADGVHFFRINADNQYTRTRLRDQGRDLPTNAIFQTLNDLPEDKFSDLILNGNEMLAPAEYLGKEEWQGRPMEVIRIRFLARRPEDEKGDLLFYIGADDMIYRLRFRRPDSEEEIYFPVLKINEPLPAETFLFTPPAGARPVDQPTPRP